MSAVLFYKTGHDPTRTLTLPGPGKFTVGRLEPAQFAVPADSMLSRVHFELNWDGKALRVRDLGSRNGLLIDRVKQAEFVVEPGMSFSAGRTLFTFRGDAAVKTYRVASKTVDMILPDHALRNPTLRISASADKPQELRDFLKHQLNPLFALVDAARDPKVLPLIKESATEYQSLYEGAAEEISAFGPYLVRVMPESTLFTALLKEGWGKSWGVLLTCVQPFKELRKHLRHFLMVQLEDRRQLYFRFYDPRVLRIYLPTCNVDEAKTFFGPIDQFLCEGEDNATLVVFRPEGKGVLRTFQKLLTQAS